MDHGTGGERDPLRDLLHRADSSIDVPPDLRERVTRPRLGEDRRPVWQPLLVAAAAAVLLLGGAFAGGVLFGRHGEPGASPLEKGARPVDLTVYDAERACQSLRTIECGIGVMDEPKLKSGTALARVWQGDPVHADCVDPRGDLVVDESGVSSTRWYHVVVPSSGVTGWLPGVRTRNTVEVPICRTS